MKKVHPNLHPIRAINTIFHYPLMSQFIKEGEQAIDHEVREIRERRLLEMSSLLDGLFDDGNTSESPPPEAASKPRLRRSISEKGPSNFTSTQPESMAETANKPRLRRSISEKGPSNSTSTRSNKCIYFCCYTGY